MTILHAGGELSAFIAPVLGTSDVTEVTTAGEFNATYARSAISVGGNSGTKFSTPQFASSTDFWLHCEKKTVGSTSQGTVNVIEFFNSSGTNVVRLTNQTGFASAVGTWRPEIWNGSTWQAGAGTAFTHTSSSIIIVDVHIVVGGSTTTVDLYHGGALQASVSVSTTAVSNIASVSFKNHDSSSPTRYSQIICTDAENTIGMKLATMVPNANSAVNTAWTGDYTAIDEATTVDDTDFISGANDGDVETYGCTDATVVSGMTVKALVVTARVKKGATGPQNVQAAVRIGSTNYYSGNLSNVTSGFGPVVGVFTQDPSTSAAWNVTNLNAAEIGLKSVT